MINGRPGWRTGVLVGVAAIALPLFWGGAGHAAPAQTPEAAREQAATQMDVMMFRIKMFHHEIHSSMLATMELPYFKQYFSLPESGSNTLDALGVVRFSKAQVKVRKSIEKWAAELHKRFPIGEVCLIDKTGQEHLRVVGGKVEADHFFAATEGDSPFFRRAFALDAMGIFVSDPYMSPDSRQWVIAYASPVVLESGEKPAFFHFEVPLDVYGQLISTRDFGYARSQGKLQPDIGEEGRFFIVDREGLVIADSRRKSRLELRSVRDPAKNPDAADFGPPEKLADYLPTAASIIDDARFLEETLRMRRGEAGQAQLTLKGREYILIHQPIPGRPWSLAHLDPVGGKGFWEESKP